MKKVFKKITAITLSAIFVFSACFGLIFFLKNNGEKDEMLSISANATQYTEFSAPYDKNRFKCSTNSEQEISIGEKLKENTISSYSTRLSSREDSTTTINVLENIDSMGNLRDDIEINGVFYGSIGYNEEGFISSNTLNRNNVYYDYDENKITSLMVNDSIYNYNYDGTTLSEILLDNDLYSSYYYSAYGKISQEYYPFFERMFEHTNVATIESAYDVETGTTILAKIYDYINDTPYNITKNNILIDGTSYEVITEITKGEDFVQFDYKYAYNNVPYITNVKTATDEYSLSYINDKIITKTKQNEIYTYVYSSTGTILGMVVGKIIDDEYFSMFVTFVSDGFGNVIEANYLNVETEDEMFRLDVKKLYQQQFDCIGHKVFCNNYYEGIDTKFGFNGAFEIGALDLIYKDGNIYSPLLSDYIYQPSEDSLQRRTFVTNTQKRIEPTLNTVQKSIAIESLQNEILLRLDTSSTSGLTIVNNEIGIGSADIFTLPITIDGNNMFRSPSKIAFIVNADNENEVNYYTNFISTYFKMSSSTYVVMDEYYLTDLLSEDLNYQFVYNGKLFTIFLIQEGLYGYSIKGDYNKKDYLPDKNIINYDTGRYVRYFENTIDTDKYIQDCSILANFTTIKELDNFFENLGYINTSIGESYKNINFGDNSEFIQKLISNTFNLNLPEYDTEKQFLTIDENGDYVIKDIPEDASVEEGYYNINFDKILNGVLETAICVVNIVQGCLNIITGVVSGCPLLIICGVVQMAAGVSSAFIGVSTLVEGLTGENLVLEEVFGGDEQLMELTYSILITVASVAGAVGSANLNSCFVEGTKVTTQNGLVNIEDVKVGDYVLSYDEKTGCQSYNKVIDTYVNSADKLCEIVVGEEIIISTTTHPYFVSGKWVEASKLKVGDNVLLSDNTLQKVKSVKIIDKENTTVYNLNVENNHTYYANGVLVHNTCANKTIPDGDTLDNYSGMSIKDYVEKVYNKVELKYKAMGKNPSWQTVKKEIWKEVGQMLKKSPLKSKIFNLKDVVQKGNAPIMNFGGKNVRIQLHHVVSKAVDIYRVVPMTPKNHTLFHVRYGYHYFKSLERGTPWLLE